MLAGLPPDPPRPPTAAAAAPAPVAAKPAAPAPAALVPHSQLHAHPHPPPLNTALAAPGAPQLPPGARTPPFGAAATPGARQMLAPHPKRSSTWERADLPVLSAFLRASIARNPHSEDVPHVVDAGEGPALHAGSPRSPRLAS